MPETNEAVLQSPQANPVHHCLGNTKDNLIYFWLPVPSILPSVREQNLYNQNVSHLINWLYEPIASEVELQVTLFMKNKEICHSHLEIISEKLFLALIAAGVLSNTKQVQRAIEQGEKRDIEHLLVTAEIKPELTLC